MMFPVGSYSDYTSGNVRKTIWVGVKALLSDLQRSILSGLFDDDWAYKSLTYGPDSLLPVPRYAYAGL